jgi:HD-like signal output (HDOD) protein
MPADTPTTPELSLQRQQVVNAAIADVSHIATLPEITMKIIEVVERPDSTAQDLHKIIANDPALCARILKVVNSAFYGLPGQIGSINRAIVLLGLNAVKNIAIAASLAKLFKGGKLTANFTAKDLWSHSIAVGATVKVLAEKTKLKLADEAFLAGLIHDLGIMVQMQACRPQLIEVFDHMREGGLSMLAAERHVFSGADHQDFGMALCEKWKFPRSFAYVTGFHHRPLSLDPESRTLTSLVHVADILAAKQCIGFTGTVPTLEISADVLDELKLTPASLDEISANIPQAFEVADSLLSS